jgi:hypothetical protein
MFRRHAERDRPKNCSFCGLRSRERHASANPQTIQSQKAVSHFKISKSRERARFWDSVVIYRLFISDYSANASFLLSLLTPKRVNPRNYRKWVGDSFRAQDRPGAAIALQAGRKRGVDR